MVGIRIHGAADAVDHLKRVHGLTVDKPLQVHVVEAVLCLQTLGHALGNGLDDNDRGIEICFLIHLPDNPIYESAEEVAFAKLYDALWTDGLGSGCAVEFLHNLSLFRCFVISLFRYHVIPL